MPEIAEATPVAGVEYYEGRTDGWSWFGETCWWEKFIVWDGGFNGLLQPSCERRWRWNGSQQTLRRDYVFLDWIELASMANAERR